MKLKNIVLITIITLIVIIVRFIMTHWLMFFYGTFIMYGPLPILKLLPYNTEQRRVAFPQWINDEEICYLELVLHFNDYSNKSVSFIRMPVTDMYIYREKIGRPETKKLIKHIARQDIEPDSSLEGSLDKSLGFRVYDKGKNIFLYYTYSGYGPARGYRYITMNINGGNVKERIPKIIPPDTSEDGKIIPMDISQDGKKLYGIIKVNTLPDIYAIADYTIKTKKAKKLLDITDEKFRETRNAQIYDLKLVSKDRLVLSYEKDCNVSGIADYIYLTDINNNIAILVDKLTGTYYDNAPNYDNSGEYGHDPHYGYALSKNGDYLVCGNVGIYKQENANRTKVRGFYKEYPAISPDGTKIAFIDILTKRGELNSLWFAGRELKVMDLKDLITDAGVSQ